MELGTSVRDKITGFSGVVTGYVQYLTGCNQCLVVPKSKGGALIESQWFDVQRFQPLSVKRIMLDNSKSPGFDKPAPKR